MTAPRAGRRTTEEGFTLIELLVVIIIIGILTAIAIPTFLATRERAYDATAKSDVRTLANFEEAYIVNAGRYGSFVDLGVDAYSAIPSPRVTVSVWYDGGTGYCLSAKHALSPTTWYYDNQAGGLQPKGATGCPVTTTGVSGGSITGVNP